MEKSTSNVILYIIDKLGGSIEGRKKLMKLMFLIEHWDPVKGLTREGPLKNEFIIYYYGVFSFEVMENFIKLVQEGKIEDGFPIKLKNKIEIKINDEKLKEKVDKVLEQFKNKSGYELEIETLKMLKIQPFEKNKYFGKSIREII